MLQLRIFNSIKLGIFRTPKTEILHKQAIPSFFIHTQSHVKREEEEHTLKDEKYPDLVPLAVIRQKKAADLLPIEVLRKKAWEIEEKAALRPRCRWTREETNKLMNLVEELGPKWSLISSMFVDRSPSNVLNHYRLQTDNKSHGPWSEEELKILRELGNGRTYQDIADWDKFQEKLPSRPLFLIRQAYKHSVDPSIKRGRWTAKETERLRELVEKHGEENMKLVAQLMGSRTKRQCLERWKWQIQGNIKGRFTAEENRLIIDAVKRYGENFAVVCKVTGIQRTPRHVSQHYATMLHPSIDRSEWTDKEEELVYNTCLENKRDMVKTKEMLNSKRAIRDMWNHFYKIDRLAKSRNNTQ